VTRRAHHAGGPRGATAAILGAYAAVLAGAHGLFSVLQGPGVTPTLPFLAVGPPCRPETAWHGCLPALTVVPDVQTTGVLALLASAALAVAAVAPWRRRGTALLALSLLLLLVGGGFVPVLIGVAAAVAAPSPRGTPRAVDPAGSRLVHGLARTWPWALALYLGFAAVQTLAGFAAAGLGEIVAPPVAVLDLALLALSVAGARARDAVAAAPHGTSRR
jgi:hypothetical protein